MSQMNMECIVPFNPLQNWSVRFDKIVLSICQNGEPIPYIEPYINNKENIIKESSDIQETNSISNTNIPSSEIYDLNTESPSSKPNPLTSRKIIVAKQTTNNTDIIKSYSFNEQVEEAIFDWLEYKKEKRQAYKPKGLEVLLKKLKLDCHEHSNQYVINSINNSMTNNYVGIFPPRQTNNTSFGRGKKQVVDTSKIDKNGVVSL